MNGTARPPKSGRYIAELDGLRGIAIGLVLLVHFGGRVPPVDAVTAWFKALCDVGWVGVDIFLCVSGFLITGILLDTRAKRGFYKNFYARRALRIFPLYFGVLAAVFLVVPLVAPAWAETGIASAWLWTYTANVPLAAEGPAVFRGETFNFAHFWSLAIEEQFYLIWPPLVAVLGRRGLARPCVMLLAAATPLRIWAYLTLGAFGPFYLTFCRIDALLAGALLAVAVRGERPEASLAVAKKVGLVSFAALAAWFVLAGRLYCFDPAVTVFATPLLAGLSVGAVAAAVDPSPAGSRLFRFAPLAELGRVSYGLYVFHGLLQVVFWGLLDDVVAATGGRYWASWLTFMTLACGTSYLLARASFVLESRILRLKRHFVFEPERPAAAVAPSPGPAAATAV